MFGVGAAEIAGMLCQLVVWSLIGAVILRAACSLYNKLAGASPPGLGKGAPSAFEESQAFTTAETGPYAPPTAVGRYKRESSGGVPEPDFSRAWLIMFLVMLAQFAVNFVVGMVVGVFFAAQMEAGQPTPGLLAAVVLLSLPISLVVMAGILTGMLPTSFGRALLVTLLHMAVGIAVAIVIVLVVVIVVAVVGGGFAAFGAMIAV